jgi:hypothetical protein
MLRFLYEHKWHTATADTKTLDKFPFPTNLPARTLVAIGVYSLAKKYEIDGLRACALDQIPPPLSQNSPFAPTGVNIQDICDVIDTHYNSCLKGDCAMGRKLCLAIIKWKPYIVHQGAFLDLAREHINLAADMYFAGCENNGKLW